LPEISGIILIPIPGPVVLTVIELVSVKSIYINSSNIRGFNSYGSSATASRIIDYLNSINSHVYAQIGESVVKSIPSFPNIIVIANGRISHPFQVTNKEEVRTN
jgi:hypothetical protein